MTTLPSDPGASETAPTRVRGGATHGGRARRAALGVSTGRYESFASAVRIGRYSVLHPLGVGGMGVVVMAYDDELDRKVAIKLVRTDRAVSRERVLREAQALAKISHPNVVGIYEIGDHEGDIYLAMEFVRGETLRAWLRQTSREWREVVDVLIQAGRGLMAVHAVGIVHRDFKPKRRLLV